MRARAVGSNTMFITWEKPRQANGNIRGYFLTFESKIFRNFNKKTLFTDIFTDHCIYSRSQRISDLHAETIEETYVLNRQMYYLHEEAEPDTGYKISVWAETYGGEGPKVVRPVRTWPLRGVDWSIN